MLEQVIYDGGARQADLDGAEALAEAALHDYRQRYAKAPSFGRSECESRGSFAAPPGFSGTLLSVSVVPLAERNDL